jgi:hypothetical protein
MTTKRREFWIVYEPIDNYYCAFKKPLAGSVYCREVLPGDQDLQAEIERLREALKSAEETFYLAWIMNEGFDDEESKFKLFEMVFNGRENARKALGGSDES